MSATMLSPAQQQIVDLLEGLPYAATVTITVERTEYRRNGLSTHHTEVIISGGYFFPDRHLCRHCGAGHDRDNLHARFVWKWGRFTGHTITGNPSVYGGRRGTLADGVYAIKDAAEAATKREKEHKS